MEYQRKAIDGYDGVYEVDTEGNVFSNNYGREKILKQSLNNYGYLYVNLSKKGRTKTKGVSILIAKAFVPNPENKPEVNHIDQNRINNKAENLNWMTRLENMNHGSDEEGYKKAIGRKTKITYPDGAVREYKTTRAASRDAFGNGNFIQAKRKGNTGYCKFEFRGCLVEIPNK